MSWKLNPEPRAMSDGDLWLIHNASGKEMARSFNKCNAALVAAAPDLLAACEWTLRYFDQKMLSPDEEPRFLDRVRTALRKAKGES